MACAQNYEPNYMMGLYQETSTLYFEDYDLSSAETTTSPGVVVNTSSSSTTAPSPAQRRLPRQLTISDVARGVYGIAILTVAIQLLSDLETYGMSHVGAAYGGYSLALPTWSKYGSATSPTPTVVKPTAGVFKMFSFTLSPSTRAMPFKVPVFGGYIQVASGDDKELSVLCIGPASLVL
ncbi:hypothetical protein PG991_002952 [Apiospora marii]|uniref:Uncharacterized protein n=1 Tax=Apiospora marii TaxID=335849 RepID=A0ABR1SGV2_9PEZI